jgi:hypothetical protein
MAVLRQKSVRVAVRETSVRGGGLRTRSDRSNTSQKLNEITLNQPNAASALRDPFRFSGDRLDYRRVSLLVMPHLSYPTAIFLVATCIFVILAKLLKVGKGAVAMGVGVLIVWLVLHFTGYEETVYNIIFNPPPIQHAQPEDLIKR